MGRVLAHGLLALATGLGLVVGSAHAEDWIASARAANNVYSTDLSSLKRTGDVVESWERRAPTAPETDPKTGKPFTAELSKRYDDCASRRNGYGAYLRRDAFGEVVSSGEFPGGWHDIAPGSVGESIWRLTCAATSPPKVEPILTDVDAERWTSLGKSADGKMVLSAALERVVAIADGKAFVASKAEYPTPQIIDGLPIRLMVTLQVFDCATGKIATGATDLYLNKSLRVRSSRPDLKTIVFESAAPGSFAFRNRDQICASAAADASRRRAEGGSSSGGVSVGTGWAVVKGYIVTASHVIHDGRSILVYSNGERVGTARVVADDVANDVAILKVSDWKGGKLVALPLSRRPATLGKKVFTLGFPEPGVLGKAIKMTSGEVSSTSGAEDDARFLQIAVPIQQGNSGGPIITLEGDVLGIVDSKLTAFDKERNGPAPEMVNYAVKASYVRPLLDDLPDLANYTPLKPHLAGEALVAETRKAVFLLVVK